MVTSENVFKVSRKKMIVCNWHKGSQKLTVHYAVFFSLLAIIILPLMFSYHHCLTYTYATGGGYLNYILIVLKFPGDQIAQSLSIPIIHSNLSAGLFFPDVLHS